MKFYVGKSDFFKPAFLGGEDFSPIFDDCSSEKSKKQDTDGIQSIFMRGRRVAGCCLPGIGAEERQA